MHLLYDVTEQTRHTNRANLMDTLRLTLKMTTAEDVEMSVTATNSFSQDYTNLDAHISQTCCKSKYSYYICLCQIWQLAGEGFKSAVTGKQYYKQTLSHLEALHWQIKSPDVRHWVKQPMGGHIWKLVIFFGQSLFVWMAPKQNIFSNLQTTTRNFMMLLIPVS